MKYLVQPSKLGALGAALLAQLRDVQSMEAPPPLPVAQVPNHDQPSPTKVFSNRGKRRLGITAAMRKGKRKMEKASRRRNRGK